MVALVSDAPIDSGLKAAVLHLLNAQNDPSRVLIKNKCKGNVLSEEEVGDVILTHTTPTNLSVLWVTGDPAAPYIHAGLSVLEPTL